MEKLKDIQISRDERGIEIKKVGIKGLKYPISVMDRLNGVQHTVADVSLLVNLPKHVRGTHMSRFVEVFNAYSSNITMKEFMQMLEAIREKLEASRSYGKIKFPYFIEKTSPATSTKSFLMYMCVFSGSFGFDGKKNKFRVSVRVPIQTLCPCSKEISKYGAHNQRGRVDVTLEIASFFWIEDLISIVEKVASSPLYSLLKRPDEKFVTEHAYENPKFVEDIVRDVCLHLPKLGDFSRCIVKAENFESIHLHNAFAVCDGSCKGGKFYQSNL